MIRFGSSYFRNDVSGLGADDQALSFADQALITLVSPRGATTYSEWATQTDDVTWSPVTNPKDYQAYAITDYDLVAVASAASSEVSRLAVISPVLTRQDAVEKAFEGTPFAYDHTEAVYSDLDPQATPQIFFVYWLTLRDANDPKIGPTSLNYAATLIAGVLAYIVFTAPTASSPPRPGASFPTALQQQIARGTSISIPQTPATQATVPVMPAPSSSSTPAPIVPVPTLPLPPAAQQASVVATPSDNLKALLLVSLGAGSAILAYRYFSSRKRAG
jgi:hypothetical protein